MHDVDQFVGRHARWAICRRGGIDQVLPDVVLKDFCNEALQGSTTRRRLLQDSCAFLVTFDRALNCLNLSPDALQAVQQFRPVPFNMSHS